MFFLSFLFIGRKIGREVEEGVFFWRKFFLYIIYKDC